MATDLLLNDLKTNGLAVYFVKDVLKIMLTFDWVNDPWSGRWENCGFLTVRHLLNVLERRYGTCQPVK